MSGVFPATLYRSSGAPQNIALGIIRRHYGGRVSPASRPLWRRAAGKAQNGSASSEVPPPVSEGQRILYEQESILRGGFSGGFGHNLSSDLVERMLDLPGTQGVTDIMIRTNAMSQWRNALKKGYVPHADEVEWPAEPFRSKFAKTLQDLEMPGFIRRYPGLLNTLCNQMLDLVYKFEEALLEMEASNDGSTENPQGQPQQQQQQASGNQGDQQGMEGAGDGPMRPEDFTEEMMKEALEQQNSSGSGNDENSTELEIELESKDGQMQGDTGSPNEKDQEKEDEIAEELAALTEDLVEEFKEQLEPVMGNLKKAKATFEDLGELLDEKKGFDLSSGMWQRIGWDEMEKLRRKLQDLKELRELVRSLGRAGGKGPMRRAPAEVYKSGNPPGVIRSPLQPEETRGLARSGDLSRMLPAEAALMAAGWPKQIEGSETKREGSRAARLLHLARRAERNLLSYERAGTLSVKSRLILSGWLDDQPSKVLQRTEFRPAAEQGPIIVCLDTSSSMVGAREVVAKAVVLECLRGAHRQQRLCYLYAFSGPKDVQELELGMDSKSMERLLEFLEFSFKGGTCVEEALSLSINRLNNKEWAQADILIVTDGEMALPTEELMDRLQKAMTDLGLEVHGLLVGNSDSPAMEAICSHMHMFKSWDAVRRK
ncbi:hypothetical protein BSKO_00652 [Bryopsis sp. KO-2023]|nr:hypothetical protein BSKO_00652 [Bryopsis sp. KO-2023]